MTSTHRFRARIPTSVRGESLPKPGRRDRTEHATGSRAASQIERHRCRSFSLVNCRKPVLGFPVRHPVVVSRGYSADRGDSRIPDGSYDFVGDRGEFAPLIRWEQREIVLYLGQSSNHVDIIDRASVDKSFHFVQGVVVISFHPPWRWNSLTRIGAARVLGPSVPVRRKPRSA